MRAGAAIAGLSALVVGIAALITVPIVLVTVPEEPTGRASASASASTERDTIRVAIAGDSLSAGTSGFSGNGLDAGSWMTYAQGGRVRYVGGWAQAGATPEQIAAAVRPIGRVDVLVVLAGTNAVRTGRSLEEERISYERIVATIAPRVVIVSSIPPYGPNPGGAIRYNRLLREYSQERGWTWSDSWQWARNGNGWKTGASADGVHPATFAGYRMLGEELRCRILAAAG